MEGCFSLDLSREIPKNSKVYPVAPEDGTGAYFTGTRPLMGDPFL